jgi:hypothetical protein
MWSKSRGCGGSSQFWICMFRPPAGRTQMCFLSINKYELIKESKSSIF